MFHAVLHQRVIVAHVLDELAVALAARVGHGDAVEGRWVWWLVVDGRGGQCACMFVFAKWVKHDRLYE